MNNVILLLGCLILFVITYYLNQGRVLNPSVLITAGFCLSSFIFCLSYKTWQYEISDKTITYILCSLLFFCFGTRFGKRIKLEYKEGCNQSLNFGFSINRTGFIIICFIEMIYIILRAYSIISTVGSLSLSTGVLGEYRTFSGTIRFDFPLKILAAIVGIIGAFTSMLLIDAIVGKKEKKYYLITLILYFISNLLSSARIEAIYVFIYLFAAYFLVQNSENKTGISIKTIVIVCLAGFVLIRLFLSMGYLTGKTQIQTSAADNIYIYGGSSIGALDVYISSFDYDSSNFFTLCGKGIFTLLSYFGIKIGKTVSDGGGFILYGNMTHTTNIYTGLMYILHDFGYVGSMFVVFLQGCIYQIFYRKATKNLKSGRIAWTVFYIYITPYILLTSITDRFFTQQLTITTIVVIVSLRLIMHATRAVIKE